MKNKFLALISIIVHCISTNSALAYNKDIANIKQSGTTVAMMKSSPAYEVGFVSGYAGKDEFDVTTCAQFQLEYISMPSV
jgi:hypothetical protein